MFDIYGPINYAKTLTEVAWKAYKTRINRALRLLDASLTSFGHLLDNFCASWGRLGHNFSI